MFAWLWIYQKHWIVHFKKVNFMVVNFILIKLWKGNIPHVKIYHRFSQRENKCKKENKGYTTWCYKEERTTEEGFCCLLQQTFTISVWEETSLQALSTPTPKIKLCKIKSYVARCHFAENMTSETETMLCKLG